MNVLRLDSSQLARGLRCLLAAFNGLGERQSVRLEWQDPFLWLGTNHGHVWAWCRLLPLEADADEMPAIEVPLVALAGPDEQATTTIELGDRSIRVTRPGHSPQEHRTAPAKWPQFRIAQRLVQQVAPRIDPDRDRTHVSLGWIPARHLRDLLSLAVTGSDQTLLKKNPALQLAMGAQESWAYCQSPVGYCAAAVGSGVERPMEFAIPYVMARAVTLGALEPAGGRSAGWAAITMGMPSFGEWWASFVAGDDSMRVGVSAPSGYDDLLQLLGLQLPAMAVDSAFVLSGPLSVAAPPDGTTSKKRTGCLTLADDRMDLEVDGAIDRAGGILHGRGGQRCARQTDVHEVLRDVSPVCFGWFDVPDPEQIWMSWTRTADGHPQLVGMRSVAGGALTQASIAASPADFVMMPRPREARPPKINVTDGMLLDVLAYVEGMASYEWRESKEFRELMDGVFLARRVLRRAEGKNLWDIDENAGIIQGVGGTKYVVLPGGEMAIFATQDKLDRARKFLHIGGSNG